MKIGDIIPDITLEDHNSKQFRFRDLVGHKAVVVYFYPKNFTPGCTKEACGFRDSYESFAEVGAEVIGVSADSSKSHARFIGRHKLPYILLSDENKTARKAFDVKSNLLGLLPGRETFIFDKEGRLVHRFNSMNASRHMPEALAVLKKKLH